MYFPSPFLSNIYTAGSSQYTKARKRKKEVSRLKRGKYNCLCHRYDHVHTDNAKQSTQKLPESVEI
jgi:hypothetical protein